MGDGSSGAPVPAAGDYGARIVSIISAGTRDGDGTIACGMELPTLAADLKARPRAGIPKSEAKPKTDLPGIRRVGIGPDGNYTGARFVKP